VVLDILCTMQQDTKWLSTVMYCRPTCQQDVVVLFAAMQTVKMGTTGYRMQTLQQIVNCALITKIKLVTEHRSCLFILLQ